MTYIIIETQTTDGATTIVPPETYADRNTAEARFHTILGFAAVSTVEKHTCMMLTDEGELLRSECYFHEKKGQWE